MPLLSGEPDKQANAREFFSVVEEQSGHHVQTPKDGTFDNVKALLVVGAHIARHTIFEHRQI